MPAPSYTYTLANSTTADASQVMQNFNDILNGVSDGTKDLSINALTCAGTATFNGNVTLGNATSDDLAATGRWASNLDPKTAATYDHGTSTQTWRALYLDNTATDGGAVYFDAGTTKFVKSSADGATLNLGGFSKISSPWVTQNSTAIASTNYTITDSDGYSVILVTTGAAQRTITLPTPANNTGRVLTIKKVDSGAGTVLIDTPGAETIDGAAQNVLNAQYAFVQLACDGSNWSVLDVFDFVSGNISGSNFSSTSIINLGTISITSAGTWRIIVAGHIENVNVIASNFNAFAISNNNNDIPITDPLSVGIDKGRFDYNSAIVYGAIPVGPYDVRATTSFSRYVNFQSAGYGSGTGKARYFYTAYRYA